jgi:predicted RecA/RadA family phage recombinase
MKNFKQSGDTVTLIAAAAVASGAGILVGSIFGIATNAAAIGEEVEAKRTGVFTVAKNSAEAWAVGDKVYWDDTAKVFTITNTADTLVGAAYAVAANPSAIGTVLLDGAIR